MTERSSTDGESPAKSVNRGVKFLSIVDFSSRVVEPSVMGFGKCRQVNDFEKLNCVGEGTYGIVYRARDKTTGHIVALKKVRNDEKCEGISESALREIHLLKQLKHMNVVRLHEVAVGRDLKSMFLVMEFCEQDIASLLDNLKLPFTESQVKCLALQLFRALKYLHHNNILHRDLKVSNLLLTNEGILKVADFGLARTFGDPSAQMSPHVVTLWYRSPELLFDSTEQTPALDMWAAGCILGELLIHKPLLPGKNEMDQINRIIQFLGTPNPKLWPEMVNLPVLKTFQLKQQPYNNVKKVSPAGQELLNSLFLYNPAMRATADDALASPYFIEPPLPCSPDLMPSFPQHRNRKRRCDSPSDGPRLKV